MAANRPSENRIEAEQDRTSIMNSRVRNPSCPKMILKNSIKQQEHSKTFKKQNIKQGKCSVNLQILTRWESLHPTSAPTTTTLNMCYHALYKIQSLDPLGWLCAIYWPNYEERHVPNVRSIKSPVWTPWGRYGMVRGCYVRYVQAGNV